MAGPKWGKYKVDLQHIYNHAKKLRKGTATDVDKHLRTSLVKSREIIILDYDLLNKMEVHKSIVL